ncbi:MAG: Holliday junction branch migration protein RuvA [Gammaproteobacteria bacterium]|nr:Holliday junction branch migration protein RuvA [Gammaproteobacteria bacterium]MBT8111092.1 Holliday junction branch migration protein RuvA [Gammaproteobacteria bacterium]NND48009.1 Holliday junction branch migration protein RuvA [Woeseiaceae bacterium]NNL45790.1 Holliday junction branch migration protein RuvA [Woeseiaceae bacterium]
MIGSLRGRLLSKQAPRIVIDCNGVGYEVETPMSTFLDLPAAGTELFLHTHLLVREDAQILYGFATEDERLLFRTLLKVNRVGAKMALGVLSAMTAGDFRRCVEFEDTTTLSKIPGVGKKTAERLIIEMRDRIDKVAPMAAGAAPPGAGASARSEAFDALVSLGYKPNEVNKLIAKLDTDKMSAESIIRQALKQAAH